MRVVALPEPAVRVDQREAGSDQGRDDVSAASIDTLLAEVVRLTALLDRFVIAHARDHGVSERAVRYEFGLLARPEEWAEDRP